MIDGRLEIAGLWICAVMLGGCGDGTKKTTGIDANVGPDLSAETFVDTNPDLLTPQPGDANLGPDLSDTTFDGANPDLSTPQTGTDANAGPDLSGTAFTDANPDLPALQAPECPLTRGDGGDPQITRLSIEARLPSGSCPIEGRCEYAAYLESTCSDGGRGLSLWHWGCYCVGVSWNCSGTSLSDSCPKAPLIDGGT